MLYRPGLLGRLPCPMDWYAGSGPPTINEDFTTAIPSGWIFSRGTGASNCLYTDSATAPAYTAYAANVPRFLDFGLLMEPQRTNLFLNSEAPVTQTITLAVGDYVFWYLGPVASSINMVLGTAVGSGFNPQLGSFGTLHITTAGTVTINCVSSPTRVQLEAGLGPTSYIASTATAQTRQEDRLYKNYLGGQLNVNEGTYWVEWSSQYPVSVAGLTRLFTAGIGSYSSDANTDQAIIFSGSPYVFSAVPFDGTSTGKAQSAMFGPRPLGAVSRTAVSMSLHRCKIAQDYALDVNPPQDPNFRPPTLLAVTLFGGGNNVPMNGFLRGFKYWPVAMPDAELKDCTGTDYYPQGPVFTFDFTTGVFPRRVALTRASVGTYFDVAGVLQTATANVPRFDYNPVTHALRGLLIEEQRINLLLQSADVSQAAWAKSGTPAAPTVTANQAVAPDGTTTAARIAYPAVSGAGNGAVIYQNILMTATAYTFSVWMRGNVGGEQISLMNSQSTAAWTSTLVTLTTSWQRFTFTTPTLTAATYYFLLGTDLRDGTQTSKGAQTIFVWGGQIEAGAFPTSYIPTTTAAVTRSADLASMPTGAWFSAASGTYQAEFNPSGLPAGLPSIISGNAGSPTVATGGDARLASAIRAVVAVFSATGPQYTFGAVNKAAFAYLSGASRAAVNGTAFGPNATAFSVTGTVVEFGSDGVTPGATALNGYLRRVQYWPRALSNTELQAATT